VEQGYSSAASAAEARIPSALVRLTPEAVYDMPKEKTKMAPLQAKTNQESESTASETTKLIRRPR